jgi:hypothetical protein
LQVSFPKATTDLERVSYRGALLSTLLQPLYKFLHSLTNVLVQIANKVRLQKKILPQWKEERWHPLLSIILTFIWIK